MNTCKGNIYIFDELSTYHRASTRINDQDGLAVLEGIYENPPVPLNSESGVRDMAREVTDLYETFVHHSICCHCMWFCQADLHVM